MLVNSSSGLFLQPTGFKWEHREQWEQHCFHCTFCVPTRQAGLGTVGTVRAVAIHRHNQVRPAEQLAADRRVPRAQAFR